MDFRGVKHDAASSGLIRFEINNVSNIAPFVIFSPAIDVQGTPWKLWVKKRPESDHLGVYLYHRESESGIWSFDLSGTIGLLNLSGGKKKHYKIQGIQKSDTRLQVNAKCNHHGVAWGIDQFMLWDDVLDERKGFIKDNKIVIEARFILSNFVGMRMNPSIDFTDENERRHDVVLVVEGEKIFASKQILALHSTIFDAMFYDDFIDVEQLRSQFELRDIDRKDFITMLNLIYSSAEEINDDNALSLLKLAEQFKIKIVFDKVEQFLIGSSKLPMLAKLKLSDQFKLIKLQDYCIGSFKTIKEITDLRETAVYKELSDNAKVSLLDKVMKFSINKHTHLF